MQSIGVREVRQNLSVYLQRVKNGEAFTVTEHGRPVAVLAPLPPDDDPLADLVAAGRVVLPTAELMDLSAPLPPLDDGGPTLSTVLQRMRDEDER